MVQSDNRRASNDSRDCSPDGPAHFLAPSQLGRRLAAAEEDPFRIVVAGDDRMPNRLSPDKTKRFKLLLVPEPVTLDAAQRRAVEGWKSQKAEVAMLSRV